MHEVRIIVVVQEEFVIEYTGQIIDRPEYERRWRELTKHDDMFMYFMTLDNVRTIDAGPMGNWARFINHSCDPNCYAEVVEVGVHKCIGIFTNRNIQKGAHFLCVVQSVYCEHRRRANIRL
jgi:SET domain-containing protein